MIKITAQKRDSVSGKPLKATSIVAEGPTAEIAMLRVHDVTSHRSDFSRKNTHRHDGACTSRLFISHVPVAEVDSLVGKLIQAANGLDVFFVDKVGFDELKSAEMLRMEAEAEIDFEKGTACYYPSLVGALDAMLKGQVQVQNRLHRMVLELQDRLHKAEHVIDSATREVEGFEDFNIQEGERHDEGC